MSTGTSTNQGEVVAAAFQRLLSTSVEDLRSSLNCSYSKATLENVGFVSLLLEACPETSKSKRAVIQTQLRKLLKEIKGK